MSRFSPGASLPDVILEAVRGERETLHTAEPGTIVEWDPEKQTATVRPGLLRGLLDDDGEYELETPPDIHDVPVVFPRSRGGYITFPIAVGDTGLIVYAMRDIGQWRYTDGQQCSPGDHRALSMAGATFLPGLVPNSEKLPNVDAEYVVVAPIAPLGVGLKLGAPDATEFVALANLIMANFTALKTAISGAGTTPGDGGAAFKLALMNALNGIPTGTSWPQPVAATKVKAK